MLIAAVFTMSIFTVLDNSEHYQYILLFFQQVYFQLF